MASGLRAKLNAISAAQPRVERRPARTGGVALFSSERPADVRLFSLDASALRRIGWGGRAFDIRRLLFLDTETTGLSGGAGTVAFLVGLGYLRGDRFVVEQLLMRDYPDEAEMLGAIAARMREFDAVCSFNGKNFDLPLLKARFAMCRMQDDWRDPEQLDLLYPARRTWRMRIGSCRLSRIEEIILGQGREHDLPGSEVPQRYFDYLRSGDMALLTDIVDHNRQDILTLGTLLAELCQIYAHPESQRDRRDLLSIGKALENQGELGVAREVYRVAAIPAPAGRLPQLYAGEAAAQAAWRAYLLERRCRNVEAMREALERMAVRRQMRDRIYVELAKLYEHRYKNPRRALRYADLALHYAAPSDVEAINARRARLKRKIEAKGLEEMQL